MTTSAPMGLPHPSLTAPQTRAGPPAPQASLLPPLCRPRCEARGATPLFASSESMVHDVQGGGGNIGFEPFALIHSRCTARFRSCMGSPSSLLSIRWMRSGSCRCLPRTPQASCGRWSPWGRRARLQPRCGARPSSCRCVREGSGVPPLCRQASCPCGGSPGVSGFHAKGSVTTCITRTPSSSLRPNFAASLEITRGVMRHSSARRLRRWTC